MSSWDEQIGGGYGLGSGTDWMKDDGPSQVTKDKQTRKSLDKAGLTGVHIDYDKDKLLTASEKAEVLYGKTKGSYKPYAADQTVYNSSDVASMFGKSVARTNQANRAASQAAALTAAPAYIGAASNIEQQHTLGLANALRGQQYGALGMLQAQAMGLAPSAAQIQLQQGMQSGLAQQLALAASQRGATNASLAQRGVMNNAAGLGQQVNSQTALLRAQEQAQAQQTYANALAGYRGQDITAAKNQADLGQAANMFNAGATQQMSLANMQAQNQNQQYYAGMQQQINLANLQAQIQQKQLNDAYEQYYFGAASNMAENQRQAQIQREALNAQNYNVAMQTNAGLASSINSADATRTAAYIGGAATLGAGLLSLGGGSK